MMQRLVKVVLVVVTAGTLLLSANRVFAGGDVELVDAMRALQYFTHKTALSIDRKNQPLAAFYAHELEEIIDELETVKAYHGIPIASLVESMLVPSFETFETALEAAQWSKVDASFNALVRACNDCHKAAKHGFIDIQRSQHNPFMQSFDVSR